MSIFCIRQNAELVLFSDSLLWALVLTPSKIKVMEVQEESGKHVLYVISGHIELCICECLDI